MRRPLAFVLVALMLPISLVLSTSVPATADGGLDSITANPANAWVVTELATGIPPSAEVSTYAAGLAASGTGSSAVTAGASGAGGLSWVQGAVNTVGVLGGLGGLLWLGGDDAPELPVPTEVVGTTPNGNVNCGWTSLVFVACNLTANPKTITVQTLPPRGSGGYVWRLFNKTTGAFVSQSAYAGPNTTNTLGLRTFEAVWELWTSTPGDNGTAVAYANHRIVAPINGATMTNPYPPVNTDPALVPRYLENKGVCRTPGGGTTIQTAITPVFYINPAATPVTMPALPDVVCPAGTFLESGTRSIKTDGQPDVPLAAPYTAPDWVGEQATNFPECMPIGSTLCQLELWKIGTGTRPDRACHDNGEACADWWIDPNRSEQYECRYGTHVLALKRCEPYKQLWTVGTLVPTDPVEPDAEVTDPYGDIDPTPEDTPDLGNCVPHFGLELLNPWWVFKATACALSWAFVPDPETLPGLAADLQATIDASNLADWQDVALAGFAGVLPEGTAGCLGPPVEWEGFTRVGLPETWYPANACDEPVKNAAHWSRIILTGIIGVMGLLKIASELMIAFGFRERPYTGPDSHSTNGGY